MKREELIRSKGYHLAMLQNELFLEIHNYLENNNISRTDLAQKLGVTKGYISQVLNGDFNFKLSKLVELSLAIGKFPKIEYKDISELEIPKKNALILKVDFSKKEADISKYRSIQKTTLNKAL